MGRILSVCELADAIAREAADQTRLLVERGVRPRVVAVRAGGSPTAAWMARRWSRACEASGITFTILEFPASASAADLATRLGDLGRDASVTGVCLLPDIQGDIDRGRAARSLPRAKDVEAVHPRNLARVLVEPESALAPSVCAAVLGSLITHEVDLYDVPVLVAGPVASLGLPLAASLAQRHAAVLLADSEGSGWQQLISQARVIVAAGLPQGAVDAPQIAEEAVLLDLGPPGPGAGQELGAGRGAFTAAATERAQAVLPAGAIDPLADAYFVHNAVVCAREQEADAAAGQGRSSGPWRRGSQPGRHN